MSEIKSKPPLKTARGAKRLTKEQKAVVALKEEAKKADQKAQTAMARAQSARKTAKAKKEKLKDVAGVLSGSKTLIEESVIAELPNDAYLYIKDKPIIFQPHPGPQTEFLAAPEDEVFYGGARGGGKSYAMLIDPLRYCTKPTHRALLLRRTMPELRDLIEHSRRLYSQAFPGAKFKEQEKEWRFPSGARIEFGYAENMADVLRYQGQSYSWIGVDELPQYPTPDVWNFLRSSLRSVDPEVPTYMRATGNPGNVGSAWVREMFIDREEWGKPFYEEVETPVGKKYISRRFIPAKLTDNPSLMKTDNYLITLSSLPEVQRKQFLEGNWDVFDNAAFPEFNRKTHVIEPFDMPNAWVRFRACDWGYSSNACVLWFAVDFDNNLYVYREFYTRQLTADVFARQVLNMEGGDPNLRYGILDSSVWQQRGDVGPSIAETMIKEGCQWRRSDRSAGSRKSGKLEIHRRLALRDTGVEDDNGAMIKAPSIKIFSTCKNLIRTLPQLPLDENDPEDVDTDAEDHAYDALRYGCMSRPLSPSQINDIVASMSRTRPVIADRTFGY